MTPLCADTERDLWFSDSAAERAEAVAICHGCPLRQRCAEEGATWGCGVWGGVDHDHADGAAAYMHGCRCRLCVHAHIDGANTYKRGCRCRLCTQANAHHAATVRAGLEPVRITPRRAA